VSCEYLPESDPIHDSRGVDSMKVDSSGVDSMKVLSLNSLVRVESAFKTTLARDEVLTRSVTRAFFNVRKEHDGGTKAPVGRLVITRHPIRTVTVDRIVH